MSGRPENLFRPLESEDPGIDYAKYEENPPDDWEDCDCCCGAHPPGFDGDCRDDRNRWPFTDRLISGISRV